MVKPARNTICLWYDGDAEDAARFYAKTFPDSSVGAVLRAPGDFPSGKKGDVLTVEFTVLGIPCLGLNGGPEFKHNEAFSFQVATADQAETDRYWNAVVGNGGKESACGWCKDRWGVSWQITPVALMKAISDPDPAAAKRAFDAMMQMTKIDIAAIEAARLSSRMAKQQPASVATLKAIADAFNAHDLDAIMEFFVDDCSLDMPRGPDSWGKRFTGKAAVREGLAARFKGLPDVHYSDDRHWVSGNVGVSEWLLTGTMPDGTRIRVRGCDHWEFRDGKVVRKDSYWKIVDKSA